MADLAQTIAEDLAAYDEMVQERVHKWAGDLTTEQFWRKPFSYGNSVGHLILHLTGNLNHFVGAQLGGSGYVRDREREFTESSLPSKEVVLANLDQAVATFRKVVSNLTADQLAAPHPESRFGSVFNTLLHLVAHFALHCGQISYIVRLLKK